MPPWSWFLWWLPASGGCLLCRRGFRAATNSCVLQHVSWHICWHMLFCALPLLKSQRFLLFWHPSSHGDTSRLQQPGLVSVWTWQKRAKVSPNKPNPQRNWSQDEHAESKVRPSALPKRYLSSAPICLLFCQSKCTLAHSPLQLALFGDLSPACIPQSNI